jgi:hypothetical protein
MIQEEGSQGEERRTARGFVVNGAPMNETPPGSRFSIGSL